MKNRERFLVNGIIGIRENKLISFIFFLLTFYFSLFTFYSAKAADITIKSHKAPGPTLQVSQPLFDGPVLQEVLDSMDLAHQGVRPIMAHPKENPNLEMDTQPFPEPPYIDFDTKNLPRSLKKWRFEVVDSEGRSVYEIAGQESLPTQLTWDGGGTKGERVIEVGHSYRFKFYLSGPTGDNVIVGTPVTFSSLSYRDQDGKK
ncbi:MAG: hypothetical protein HY399_08980, partial [Elusimicrobia bacterium]|nr:hypothetical protein [Elusimicrobiota bacterium]